MAIIQISKIQQRSGNLVDLPQLDEAEFGWASDAKRLFIGKTVPNENIEVLTSYSNISFDQINGATGNLNITAVTAENGQVLTYDGTNWVNRGGTSGGTINLGDASNVKIDGGAIGYVLETDGTGNLSWTPKSAVVFYIDDVTQATPGVVTTTTDNYLVSGAEVSITEVVGMTQLNGNSYYINSLTANTFALYSDAGLTTPVNTSLFTAYVSGGRVVSAIGSGGTTAAGGSNTTVQFNNNNLLNGSADFTWNFATNLLTINGNANISNVNVTTLVSASRFTSNVANGTAPLTVTSTTRVANLNVAYANVSDYNVVTSQTTGTFYPVFVNGSSTANYALAANSSISANLANSSISATTFVGTLSGAATTAGTVTTNAQPNITSTGTLAGLTVSGHITPNANITYDLGNNTNRFRDIYLSNSTIYLGSQTISGNSTSVTISGILVANISGNVSGNTITASTFTSNVANGTAPLTVTSTTRVANLNVAYANVTDYSVVTSQSTGTYYPTFINGSSSANYALASNSSISANLANGSLTATTFVGSLSGAATTAGTVTTNAQPNITSVGTLTSLGVSGTITGSNLVSNVANGTAPLTVTSTTRVSNLNVAYANVSDYNVVTAQSTGTYYPVFVNGSSTANYALAANSGISVNIANGAIIATTFVGNVSGNISGTITVPGSNTQVLFNDSGNANSSAGLTFDKSTNVLTSSNTISATLLTGTLTTAAQPNVTSVGTLTSLTLTATTGTLTVPIITTGANTTAGSLTGNWTLTSGSQLQATYADLAEYYTSDLDYPPGTVVEFGGDAEVTLASDGTTRVAGVVSTNPAYAMNAKCEGDYVVALALQGRVPCKVRGTIVKGDMMVSGGNGYARPSSNPSMGTVIGKALENFSGTEGIIEVAVGRL